MVVKISPASNALGAWLGASGTPTSWISGTGLRGKTLSGTSGNDYIYGPGGGGTMQGGSGDDTYFIWESADRVVELAGGGIDTIVSYASFYRLPANVENLSVESNGATGIGNAMANIIVGGNGSQRIDGGAGADILTGGWGADTFVFKPGTGRDIITDYTPGFDKIVIGGGYQHLSSFKAVQAAMTQVGADTVITLGGSDAIILKGIKTAQITAQDITLPAPSTDLRATFVDDFKSFTGNASGFRADGQSTWATSYMWGNRTLSGNNEAQYYTDSSTVGPNPFTLRDVGGAGLLDITARPTSSLPGGLTYASGVIASYTSHLQTYGYFEMQAQVPAGAGFWPAFWLLRADGTWPSELDVMEMLGQHPDTVITTLHSKATGAHTSTGNADVGDNLSTGLHSYAVSWRPDFIKWYLDGTEIFRTATPADMHSPMYMIANLAVGGAGSWPGPTNGVSSATLSIDSIRAYQFSDLAGPFRPADIRMAFIKGGASAERLQGGGGNDRIDAGAGNDTISGLAGADTLVFQAGSGKDLVTDFASGIDRILLVGQSTWTTLSSAGGLVISYNGGKDTVTLQGVAAIKAGDIIRGDAPLSGGSGSESFDRSASALAQTIMGNGGNDTIRGGSGEDWIEGGQGNDRLTGGVGRDVFVFRVWDGDDTIRDFASGVDRILIRGVGAQTVWVNPSRNAAKEVGVEIEYGNLGDSIFLVGVSALRDGDIVFG